MIPCSSPFAKCLTAPTPLRVKAPKQPQCASRQVRPQAQQAGALLSAEERFWVHRGYG